MSIVPHRDPLLAAAKIVVGAFIGLFGFVAVMVGIGFFAVLTINRGEVIAKLAAAGLGPSDLPLILLALALVMAMFVLALMFMRELLRIVVSVERSDPFVPANARRLERMGWLNLTIQCVLFLLAGIGVMLGDLRSALLAEDAINLGVAAIVLTLVLFVLARVFRVGSEMREELEGTV